MSKINFNQIDDNQIEVTIPSETPMEMVDALTKSLNSRGLIEDLQKSTLTVRYFHRKPQKAEDLADRLLKTLEDMSKSDELPYWHPKAQFANQKRVREMEIAERRAKNGIKQPSNLSTAPEPHVMPDAPTAPATPKMFDGGAAMNTAGGTGRRYATINDINKEEDLHVEGCRCDECMMEKSGYGPKGAGQYNPADNARRKAKNTGDMTGFGSNVNTKAYSTKPGQLSGKQQASVAAKIQAKANKKQPVKQWSPEQISAENAKRGLKKAWADHYPIPSAEEEILKYASESQAEKGEHAMANQLANMMMGKNMLGEDAHPVVRSMMVPPPPQPTDEQMFGHLVVSEEVAKSAEQQWHGTINNWLTEATKPISQRFSSEEEELAYWSKIKVSDRDDGSSGY